jgi:formamidopyrimidine-DNA glycosylase
MSRGGIEPLESTAAEFGAALASENHTLKRSLTDPRLFSGIGNAY